jgi:hypothetical protein
MALTLVDSGTKTTDGTEQTLSSQTNSGTYVLAIDLGAMANGDVVEIRIKTKVLSGGTSRLAYFATYANAQGVPNVYSVPVPANIEFVATVKRVSGSDRAYPWALLSF